MCTAGPFPFWDSCWLFARRGSSRAKSTAESAEAPCPLASKTICNEPGGHMSAAGILLTDPVIITRLPGGYAPISGAKIQAYLTSSTTPTPVYADGGLTTPLSNPVVANGSGQFPAIYLDPTVTYRLQVQNSA